MLVIRYGGAEPQRIASLPRRYQVLEILIGRGQNGSDGRDKVGLGSIRRPVIGLALGGGAARGLAHIGIVKTLIAHGIVPNVVVGTSIGAVVGGAYAAGHLDTLEEWARGREKADRGQSTSARNRLPEFLDTDPKFPYS